MCRRWLAYRTRLLSLALHHVALGPFRQSSPAQFLAPMHQLHPSIPQPAHHHFLTRQTQRLVFPFHLMPAPLARHRPVPLHHSLFFPVQHFVQVPRHPPMHVGRTGRLSLKPPVQRRQERPGQILVGPPQLADPLQPQRLDQPVLQHAVGPLHSPFGLRTVGQDQTPPPTAPSPAQTASAALCPPFVPPRCPPLHTGRCCPDPHTGFAATPAGAPSPPTRRSWPASSPPRKTAPTPGWSRHPPSPLTPPTSAESSPASKPTRQLRGPSQYGHQ